VTAIASSTYKTPGVYIEEVANGSHPIRAVGTNTVAFVGQTPDPNAFLNVPQYVTDWSSFTRLYAQNVTDASQMTLALAVRGFFDNGGGRCCIINHGNGPMAGGGLGPRQGLDVLETVDDVQIVCAPGHFKPEDHVALITHCSRLKDRFAILSTPQRPRTLKDLTVPEISAGGGDAPAAPARGAAKPDKSEKGEAAGPPPDAPAPGMRPNTTKMAAVYFPWVNVQKLDGSGKIATDPCGHIAGVYARVDATRGVFKAPANEVIQGIVGLDYAVTAAEQGDLNQNGINILRMISGAPLIWGARTLEDGTYVSTQRTLLMIEQSIKQGTNWMVFEPNDEPLWQAARRDIGQFLAGIHRAGALRGKTPQEAYFVQCNAENNPPESRDLGFLIVEIGVAIVKPAEFIIFRIGQQIEGATQGGANG
jgi:phage tail sheath protein FI